MNSPNNTTPPPSRNWKVVLRAAPEDLLIAEYRHRIAQQTAKATAAARPPGSPPPPAKRAGGRQPKSMICPFCQETIATVVEAKRHEPACRRRHMLYPGARFSTTINVTRITVELIRPGRSADSWETFNVETGRPIFIRSPRAFPAFVEAGLFRGRERRLNPNATIPPRPIAPKTAP